MSERLETCQNLKCNISTVGTVVFYKTKSRKDVAVVLGFCYWWCFVVCMGCLLLLLLFFVVVGFFFGGVVVVLFFCWVVLFWGFF